MASRSNPRNATSVVVSWRDTSLPEREVDADLEPPAREIVQPLGREQVPAGEVHEDVPRPYRVHAHERIHREDVPDRADVKAAQVQAVIRDQIVAARVALEREVDAQRVRQQLADAVSRG